jgi:hypothetical protein
MRVAGADLLGHRVGPRERSGVGEAIASLLFDG